jgi:hypothetical protein
MENQHLPNMHRQAKKRMYPFDFTILLRRLARDGSQGKVSNDVMVDPLSYLEFKVFGIWKRKSCVGVTHAALIQPRLVLACSGKALILP